MVSRTPSTSVIRFAPGIRRSSSALRLVDRPSAGAKPPASVRIRAAKHGPHRVVEAPLDPVGQRRSRARLGRPAHADPVGLRRRGCRRRCVILFRGSASIKTMARWNWRCSKTGARGAEHHRRAAYGGDRLSKVVIENYPEGEVEWLEAVIQATRTPAHGKSPSRGKSMSSARISWKIRPKNSFAWRRPRGALALRLFPDPPGPSRTPPARWLSCAAPMTRRHAAMSRPMRQGEGHHPLGRRRPRCRG